METEIIPTDNTPAIEQSDVFSTITEERVHDVKERMSFLTNNPRPPEWHLGGKGITNKFIQELKGGALIASEEEIAANARTEGVFEGILNKIRRGETEEFVQAHKEPETQVQEVAEPVVVDKSPELVTSPNSIMIPAKVVGALKDIDAQVAKLIGKREGIIFALTGGEEDWEISPCRTKLTKRS